MAPALGLGLLWGLLGDPGGATKVLHSLRYLHVAVSEPSLGIPQYMQMGFMDGIPFVRYDSEQGRLEPLTQWMKDGIEPGFWEWQTRNSTRNQHMDTKNMETLQERYNQSGVNSSQSSYRSHLLCRIKILPPDTSGNIPGFPSPPRLVSASLHLHPEVLRSHISPFCLHQEDLFCYPIHSVF
ncbi:class I histocompatibility antigen, F10 alpha chain-like isoform X3 [Ammospiza nelsoni]|uniref:class I histocompatibility antigen, F10 alpha chain-like isoform X3 n=1 Tax=Ammospiza nelsoni TaxID=2857394 RepID=UPI00286AA37E|nr:class I histocompatibility antigen, F10 alpha chain-like isoform X3 [Ammospiza nelsoni]